MNINTVLGTMNSEDMGITLMHEHIVNIDWGMVHAFADFYDRESVAGMFAEDAESLRPYNVSTWLDPTPISLGRDLKLMQECSERTGMNIICCTGFYAQEFPFMFMKTDLRRQIFISCDANLRSDFAMVGSRTLRDRDKSIFTAKYMRRDEIFLKLIPNLLKLGVDEEAVSEVFTLNPRRFFGEEI